MARRGLATERASVPADFLQSSFECPMAFRIEFGLSPTRAAKNVQVWGLREVHYVCRKPVIRSLHRNASKRKDSRMFNFTHARFSPHRGEYQGGPPVNDGRRFNEEEAVMPRYSLAVSTQR